MEIWKDVKGYEGFYQVSNYGNFKGLDRIINGRKWKGKLINPRINSSGYYYVELSKNGIPKKMLLHRLVAITFIENIYNKPEVNHINSIKTDNHFNNLEWVTSKENKSHYKKTSTFSLTNDKRSKTYYFKHLSEENIHRDGIIYLYLFTDLDIHGIGKLIHKSSPFISKILNDNNIINTKDKFKNKKLWDKYMKGE